jgi:hypothetical protein
MSDPSGGPGPELRRAQAARQSATLMLALDRMALDLRRRIAIG